MDGDGAEVAPAVDAAFLQMLGNAQEDRLSKQIADLKADRARLSKEKKVATKKVYNAERSKRRLKKKSEGLGSADLVDVLAMRWAKDKAKAAAAGPASASLGAAPGVSPS